MHVAGPAIMIIAPRIQMQYTGPLLALMPVVFLAGLRRKMRDIKLLFLIQSYPFDVSLCFGNADLPNCGPISYLTIALLEAKKNICYFQV